MFQPTNIMKPLFSASTTKHAVSQQTCMVMVMFTAHVHLRNRISDGHYVTVSSNSSSCQCVCYMLHLAVEQRHKRAAESEAAYALQLVLIIDSREQYSHVAHSKVDGLARHVQLVRDRNIPVEVRGLQQGDALWLAKSRWADHHPHLLTLFWLPSCQYSRRRRRRRNLQASASHVLLFPWT